MKNVQISFDEELLESVDRVAESAQLSRSAAVREALRAWIRKKQVESFEKEWIRCLKGRAGDENGEADAAWLNAESWSDE